jgi:hypothetical protein
MSVSPDSSRQLGTPAGRAALLRRGVGLELFTIAWVGVEAVGALVTAALAGSVALLAFGFDSLIELLAAAVVLRRVRYEQSGGEGSGSDRRALRLIGMSFIALAVYWWSTR